ncbi:uncharacterized mitochondrial protein AtMg00810-like [Helianthus annuus]|uniref:uncharacterized mitochondrial protein AtMg00810-like n=1 Tax=Helianthus annuus TaxID=4232 RepID=UPI000B8FA4C3|nr:uncharacterized mitochondrial protein AtMg00810-like [Helianthus annuus]
MAPPVGFDALNPAELQAAFNAMNLNQQPPDPGLMDTGAGSHVTENSVRHFTRDNNVSIEFEPFGFTVKDLKTGRHLSRHNSTGDVYPITPPQLPPQACFITTSTLPWHDRLGHPGAQGADTAYLLLYVDDIVLTASSTLLLHSIIQTLSREFAISDLGALHYFLGIKVSRHSHGLFLSQSQYAKDILARASMTACKPCTTPVDLSAKLSATEGPLFDDPTLYRSLAVALQYLTFTRPDISYAVQQVCLFMHEPREPHFAFMKRIFRYLQGTMAYGLPIVKCVSNDLIAYSDADWGGCPDSRRSTSGYCTLLGDNLISWSSKRQATISRSSAEAEYRGVANAVAEATWLRNLLFELHVPLKKATVVYCDNVSAIYLSDNPVQHQRTKHIEIDIHFVREKVRVGHIRVLHVPAANQYADIFTKGLPRDLFQSFRSSLSVCTPPAQTAGEY